MLELLAARVDMYRLLRDIFAYPLTEETLVKVRSLQADPDAAPALQAAVTGVQEALTVFGSSAVDRLNEEHTRLMSGPGLPPAPPFASYYSEQSHTLFGAETQAVTRAYREAGLEPETAGTPSDHIVLELEFMGVQAELLLTAVKEQGTEAYQAACARQRRFLGDHLMPFGRAFGKSLRDAAEGEFFRKIADLLETYLSLDAQLLTELARVSVP